MGNPFHLKTKLFYQTKINLWNWDQNSIKLKLKKKKWNFLTFKNWKVSNKIDLFRFSPFTANFSKRRVNATFKNNLYFRKLVRLKYGRLKNKEFNNIFKKHKGYKKLISKLGSRLDNNLFLLLSPISIFYLRQNILHGKVLLNGNKVNSPNINLKLFDTISLKLSDFLNNNFLYQDFQGQAVYLNYMGLNLFKYSGFNNLNEESKFKFIDGISGYLTSKDKDIVINFFSKKFNPSALQKNNISLFKEGDGLLDLPNFISILNKRYIKSKFLNNFKTREGSLSLSNITTTSAVNDNILGFFNNRFNTNNFEISINGDYLDVTFLGFSEKEVVFGGNEKYLLHYLY